MEKTENCIFCKIANKEIPAHIIWENSQFMAFLDIFPVVPGATVLISKEHRDSYIRNIDKEFTCALMEAAKEVMNLLDAKLEKNIRTKLIFEGLEISHLHAKLWPMYRGIAERTPKEPVSQKMLAEMAEKIRN
jgi:diadenosine tetraphosphate (Ap4A) HIT family hydrolase